ncbi:MAG: hypothetical protein IPL53_19735 [Ignavibacteria bacterium]|nr:hypothetical protein [Ignavibacteria bacterium]
MERYLNLRKEFINWYKITTNSFEERVNINSFPKEFISRFDKEFNKDFSKCLEIILSYEEFRSKNGKKDRSDHRHHAIDSFIIACCSRSTTQYLSTFNRIREENGIAIFDDYGNLNRKLIDRPFDYDSLKQKVKEILVVHKVNQKLINSKINKYKAKKGIKVQKTYSPQGSLHKDGIFGKLNEPEKVWYK